MLTLNEFIKLVLMKKITLITGKNGSFFCKTPYGKECEVHEISNNRTSYFEIGRIEHLLKADQLVHPIN